MSKERSGGHRPKKRFGQHFLTDDSVVSAIAGAVAARARHVGTATVIEIGPGEGVLTAALLATGLTVVAVELDRDLIGHLERRFQDETFRVIQADALRTDFRALGVDAPLVIAGNLPYNVSSPLLFHLAELGNAVDSMTFMLQKEVVDRVLAEAGSADYGRLSVMLQVTLAGAHLLDVPPEAFNPPPKVMSSVMQLTPLPQPLTTTHDATLAGLVRDAFAKRRKTLRNALRHCVLPEQLEAAGIAPEARAETVPVDAWVRLARRLDETAVEKPTGSTSDPQHGVSQQTDAG